MANIKVLAHLTIIVNDADEMAWASPESCTPTAVRKLLQKVLQGQQTVKVPQVSAVGAIDVDGIIVEWTGDHAMRVVLTLKDGLQNMPELGIGSLDKPAGWRGRPKGKKT